MKSEESKDWAELNQEYLAACIDQTRSSLRRYIARTDEDAGKSIEEQVPPGWTGPSPPAIEVVSRLFGLSAFEKSLLLLCAAFDLDSEVAKLCSQAQGSPGAQYPTFGLALAALPHAHWSALAPSSHLRRFMLIDVLSSHSVPLTASPLRAEERVLHYLTGVSYFEPQLNGMVRPVGEQGAIVNSHKRIVQRIVLAWKGARNRVPVVQLWGPDEPSKLTIAKRACADVGLELLQLPAELVPTKADEMERFVRLWTREAALLGSGLYISAEDIDSAAQKSLRRLMDGIPGPAFLGTREPWGELEQRSISIEVRKPEKQEQRTLWMGYLGPAGSPSSLNDQSLSKLVGQFDLNEHSIRVAAEEGVSAAKDGLDLYEALCEASRAATRPRLGELAEQISPRATLDDLVLPEREKRLLRELAIHVAHRHTVYTDWGFEAKLSRGLGITALFAGNSGTGKTMAAEALARELKLDLFRIDLATTVSKYIGETEKNLRKVFDAAEDGGAILFFDEADALFGKRSEVKDSHDRYANIEIGYLLQRMESYRGLAILATNMKRALDTAFVRRLRFIVDFPFPDEKSRAEIWRRIFPPNTPTSGLDIDRLARLGVTGGNIKNIALYASFLAAGEGVPVGMGHLKRAAQVEYDKMEKPLTQAEFGE
jgi:SpoVK/Ycf46/Vps4 family AAA+-type ATPase